MTGMRLGRVPIAYNEIETRLNSCDFEDSQWAGIKTFARGVGKVDQSIIFSWKFSLK